MNAGGGHNHIVMIRVADPKSVAVEDGTRPVCCYLNATAEPAETRPHNWQIKSGGKVIGVVYSPEEVKDE